MPEVITNAGAAGTDAAGVQTPSASQTPTVEERIARAAALLPGVGEAPALEPKPAPGMATEKPRAWMQPAPADPETEKPGTLADIIRAQREARQTAQAETQKRTSLEQELAQARQELARTRADRAAFEDDPVGYAKARKWSQEQQLLFGQSLLYDLAPDKADPDFRIRMFEERQKRERAEQEKAQTEARSKAEQAAIQRQVQEYYEDTAAAVRTFEAGSYPESEAWFGEDVNTYMQSLMATARNVSERATREGRVADLSPGAIAAALEAETARRLAARDQRKQARSPQRAPAAVAPATGGEQAVDTLSTRNMTGSGSPRPPAVDERERIRRAAEAAFKAR